MYKFVILAACVAYASAGVLTGEHSLVDDSLALGYAASAPIVRSSSLSLSGPILDSAPLALQADPIVRSAGVAYSSLGSAAPAQLIRSAPLDLQAVPQQTIVRSAAPLTLSQGALVNSAALSYASPAASIIRSAPLAHGSLNIVRSAPLALQAAPALNHGSLNIVRSAAPLDLQAAPALSYGSLNLIRSAAPLALQAVPALSHGSLNIVRSAPISGWSQQLNAGW